MNVVAEPFVPLAPGTALLPSAAGEARLKVLCSPAGVQPFKPVGPGPAGQPGTARSGLTCGMPSVSLRREGDRVTEIRVRCTCGQVIELDCVY